MTHVLECIKNQGKDFDTETLVSLCHHDRRTVPLDLVSGTKARSFGVMTDADPSMSARKRKCRKMDHCEGTYDQDSPTFSPRAAQDALLVSNLRTQTRDSFCFYRNQ